MLPQHERGFFLSKLVTNNARLSRNISRTIMTQGCAVMKMLHYIINHVWLLRVNSTQKYSENGHICTYQAKQRISILSDTDGTMLLPTFPHHRLLNQNPLLKDPDTPRCDGIHLVSADPKKGEWARELEIIWRGTENLSGIAQHSKVTDIAQKRCYVNYGGFVAQ